MASTFAQPMSDPNDILICTDGSLSDVYRRLCQIHERVIASSDRMEAIGDRAFGATPVPMSGAANNKPPLSGLVHQISDILVSISDAQARLSDAIQRVGSAI